MEVIFDDDLQLRVRSGQLNADAVITTCFQKVSSQCHVYITEAVNGSNTTGMQPSRILSKSPLRVIRSPMGWKQKTLRSESSNGRCPATKKDERVPFSP